MSLRTTTASRDHAPAKEDVTRGLRHQAIGRRESDKALDELVSALEGSLPDSASWKHAFDALASHLSGQVSEVHGTLFEKCDDSVHRCGKVTVSHGRVPGSGSTDRSVGARDAA